MEQSHTYGVPSSQSKMTSLKKKNNKKKDSPSKWLEWTFVLHTRFIARHVVFYFLKLNSAEMRKQC